MNINKNKTKEEQKKIVMYDTYIKEVDQAKKFYERRKRNIINRSGWDIFKSIIWIIFGGISSTITAIGIGISYCVTIIGIPFGIIYFKSIKLLITPVNKRVILHYGKHPVLNTLWLIFGGFAICVVYSLVAFILIMSVVFSSIGEQYGKFATFFFAPFGSEILHKYEFESEEDKKIIYTYQYKERIETNARYELINEGFNGYIPTYGYKKQIKGNITGFIIVQFLVIGMLLMYYFINRKYVVIGDYVYYVLTSIFVCVEIFAFFMLIAQLIYIIPSENAIFHGYINVPEAIVHLKKVKKSIIQVCKEYYDKHTKEIDEFIEKEYVY